MFPLIFIHTFLEKSFVKCIIIEHYCHNNALSIENERTAQEHGNLADTAAIMAATTRRSPEKLSSRVQYNLQLGEFV